MLDENLPAFFLKPSTDGVAHHRAVFLSHHGSDPAPGYIVHHADPNSPTLAHKNCYAAALFDAYIPDVLFGEVLARPNWTQPTNSQEDIRRNGGVPRPPQPTLPGEFVVQLYNPDQQIAVELKEGKWGGSDSWQFSLPEEVFRQPSTSVLDHGQSDPASLATTPRINFVWRKESKLSKDLTCYMTGKSTDTKRKSARKDPDIAVGLWRSMRELTIYEPNLTRVDLEDPKGLEVVLLLSAIVIKDLYFASRDRLHEIFNISNPATAAGRKSSGGGIVPPNLPQRGSSPNEQLRTNLPKLQTTPPPRTSISTATQPLPQQQQQQQQRPPPLADPRAQWELDAETMRLKAQAEAESRAAERRRRERDKADEAERRRLQKMVEEEERAARARKAAVDLETARLRQVYGVTAIPRFGQQQQQPQPSSSRQRQSAHFPVPAAASSSSSSRPTLGSNGLPLYSSSQSVSMSGANLGVNGYTRPVKKKSFFGLRGLGADDAGPRLAKKTSSMW